MSALLNEIAELPWSVQQQIWERLAKRAREEAKALQDFNRRCKAVIRKSESFIYGGGE